MNDKYKMMINSYFDNELDKGSEALLFSMLSNNEELREYFKSMNLMRATLEKEIEDFPDELEARILNNVESLSEKKGSIFTSKNFFMIASYSLAVVLIVMSFLFYKETNNYQYQLNKTINKVDKQNELMYLMMNSLPSTEIISNKENEVLITPNFRGDDEI